MGLVDLGSSWGSRLRKLRPILNEHRRNSDFESWTREIWQLGNWWLEVSGEEAAGVIYDLVDEIKKEQAKGKGVLVIPTICGNLFLDKLQAKSLVIMSNSDSWRINCDLDVAGEKFRSLRTLPTYSGIF